MLEPHRFELVRRLALDLIELCLTLRDRHLALFPLAQHHPLEQSRVSPSKLHRVSTGCVASHTPTPT